MSTPSTTAVMSPANLVVPIKSWLEVKEIYAGLVLQQREALKAADEVGTLHFYRFVDFHEHNQTGFFSAFDGSLQKYIEDFAKYLGSFFNAIFKHVVDAPSLPVEKNVDSFYEWVATNNLSGFGFYSAYPNLSVQDIRTRAGIAHGAVHKALQSPLTLIMPPKSPTHLGAAGKLITNVWPEFVKEANNIGTIHFARFVPLGTTALAYISEYDGDFDKHMQDLSSHLGPLFDEVFENIVDSPPAPVEKNAKTFASWVSTHNIKPELFYSAYPSLSVQDIREAAKAA